MERDLHVRHLEMMYDSLPSDYESQEINHLTLAYFVISGLDILNALDSIDKEQVISWVLSFQVQPQPTNKDYNRGKFCGFYGSRSIQFSSDNTAYMHHSGGHLASTYCALAMLKTLGYDLSRLDSELILVSMKTLQQHDGSFMPTDTGAEMDLRFIYCASAICFMLNNWSGMDREKAKEYILRCQSYDGGFGLVPGSESHGGGTYCAVSALYLMGFIEDDILSRSTSSSTINVSLLLEWCLQRQAVDGGFQGRSNKASDTCYAFWVSGVLRILGAQTLFDKEALREFLLTCQTKVRLLVVYTYSGRPIIIAGQTNSHVAHCLGLWCSNRIFHLNITFDTHREGIICQNFSPYTFTDSDLTLWCANIKNDKNGFKLSFD